MATQEFQYIQDILKEFYAPAIVNQVYKKAPLWAQLEKKTAEGGGKRIYIPVQTAFTEAVASRAANDYSLPTSQKNTYDASYIYMKRMYGRIQVDGFSIESAKGRGGWIDIMSGETKGVTNAFALEMDRQSLGRGEGVLAHVASTSGSTITVDNPHGIVADTPVGKFVRPGMLVDVFDVSDGTKHVAGLEVVSVNTATGLVTLSASTGISSCADGDYMVRTGAYSHTKANIGDFMGIDGIIDSADAPFTEDFQGIDRSSYDIWQAHESSTAQVISETVIQEEIDAIANRTDGEPVDLLLTTFALRNKLIDIIRADRQVSSLTLKGGWKAINYTAGEVGEIPLMAHKNCPVGYMYFACLPALKFYTLKKLVWDNKGGGIVKPVAGYDAYEAWFKMYGNIGTDCPNSMGKLTGLTTA